MHDICDHACNIVYIRIRGSLVPRPIPSFSVCNIEKLGMGPRMRLDMRFQNFGDR